MGSDPQGQVGNDKTETIRPLQQQPAYADASRGGP